MYFPSIFPTNIIFQLLLLSQIRPLPPLLSWKSQMLPRNSSPYWSATRPRRRRERTPSQRPPLHASGMRSPLEPNVWQRLPRVPPKRLTRGRGLTAKQRTRERPCKITNTRPAMSTFCLLCLKRRQHRQSFRLPCQNEAL